MIPLIILLVWFSLGLIGVILDIKYGGVWGNLTVGLALFAMLTGLGPFICGVSQFVSNKTSLNFLDKVIYTPRKGK